LVAVPFESLTPASVSTGTEAWTWLVRERPDLEIGLMLEFNAAWLSTIELKKGMFSSTLKFVRPSSPTVQRILMKFNSTDDPFCHPVEYTPTDKDLIDHSFQAARRLLMPHTMLLHTLASRFQAVRYQRAPLMRLMLRLLLRSAQAHKLLRYGVRSSYDVSHSHMAVL
jgi:phosphatidylinositol 4-kinase A